MKLLKTKDGLFTFYSAKYNQTYHSKHGVLQEAQHVFLDASGISDKINTQKDVSVLEIGFGTGFNFFLTAARAIKQHTPVVYYSVENDLPGYNYMKQLNYGEQFSDNRSWLGFLKWRRMAGKLKTGHYELKFQDIMLHLLYDNALNIDLPENLFDAVYHDAFSPDANPELWTTSFFKKIKLSMKTGAKLSTYSAKGSVKRALQEAGFTVEKRPGPKGKREMLLAIKNS